MNDNQLNIKNCPTEIPLGTTFNILSESEIMQNWQGDINTPMVSICSTTYNHEAFIAEAIESFLMQKSTFPFEIIIDDDCSTDNSQTIIRSYAEKYPAIIKANFRNENVGAMTNWLGGLKRAKGKYIALCEGDDYWTDPLKLQTQINAFKKYPSIHMSFHLSATLTNGILSNPKLHKSDNVYSTKEIILSDFHFIQTNTILFKKEALINLNMKLLDKSPVGDVWIRIATSIPNGAIFINKVMSTYRAQSDNSWSKSINEDNNKFALYIENMLKIIDDFDQDFKYIYTKEFKIYKNKFILVLMQKNHMDISTKKKILENYKKSFTLQNRFFWILLDIYPAIQDFITMLKQKIKGIIKW